MKFSLVLLGLLSFCASGVSLACVNAEKLAKTEALYHLNDKGGENCQVVSVKNFMNWPAKKTESWTVKVSCQNIKNVQPVTVSFKTVEENACKVTKVKLERLTGDLCGLSEEWGGLDGEEWNFDESKYLVLETLSASELKALPDYVQKQIIATTQSKEIKDVVEAVKYLVDNSDDGATYSSFTFKGEKYDAVKYFPGDNPAGLIFKSGSSNVFAYNGDDSISCASNF